MAFALDRIGAAFGPSKASHCDEPKYTRPLIFGTKRVKYWILSLLWLAAAVYFWAWWLRPEHNVGGARYWVVTVAMGWLYFLQIFFIFIFTKARVPAAAPPAPGTTRVAMIVTKTPSEPLDLLKITLRAMLAQDYPHDTWLADEDPQPETLAWCEANGVLVSSRKGQADYHRAAWPRRTRCKEGNLAYFYDNWGYDNYDFVAQLDADHVPQPGYLTELLRGFVDPQVGYVSAPSICSSNASQSWAARARLDTEAGFHGILQAGYSGVLQPMCIGSHYAVRTSALREVGGLGPDLAEDHSTTMLLSAGGWRGVHALDAIAIGAGPANVADMCTQEFQWSRSLLTLLLQHTRNYLPSLPARLRFQFLFCQMLYPIFAVFMLTLYLVPIVALVFDVRYANVTFPAFLGHSLPVAVAMTVIAFVIRRDKFFRPVDSRVLSWEKALFLCMQWPWVFWGCVVALRDWVTGNFVDFRITPKGENVDVRLPMRVVLPYASLALGAALPVLLLDDVVDAKGFYLLTAFNALVYGIIALLVVTRHFSENGIPIRTGLRTTGWQLGIATTTLVVVFCSIHLRGLESLHALTIGLDAFHVTRAESYVSGAGISSPDKVRLYFDLGWN